LTQASTLQFVLTLSWSMWASTRCSHYSHNFPH